MRPVSGEAGWVAGPAALDGAHLAKGEGGASTTMPSPSPSPSPSPNQAPSLHGAHVALALALTLMDGAHVTAVGREDLQPVVAAVRDEHAALDGQEEARAVQASVRAAPRAEARDGVQA